MLPQATLALDRKPTFSVDYVVRIVASNPSLAEVRWELRGIHEIEELQLDFRGRDISKLRASGTLQEGSGKVRWRPAGPYGFLSYTVPLKHSRPGGGGFDSYGTEGWALTRARQLFPKTAVRVSPRWEASAHARARLIFRLPEGWKSVTPWPRVAGDTYELSDPGKILVRPRGWFALGALHVSHEEIADIMVQMVSTGGADAQSAAVFDMLTRTLPALKKMLDASPARLLIVRGPDPMWRGGISGEDSFFLHADRPLRTADQTSPFLHELFHVLQPNAPGPDADWITEGLAEYFSVELQRRSGLLDDERFGKALRSFEKFGLWNVNLTAQQDNAATNNSAPLVMYALDQRIQHATAGKRRLDDVVALLAAQGGSVDSERFRRVASQVCGKKLHKFFDRHVYQGIPPKWTEASSSGT